MATRDRVTFDLALPVCAFVLIALLSWLVPVRAYAQTSSATDFSFQRWMTRTVSGSASGLQFFGDGTAKVVNGGRVIGEFAFKEKRLANIAMLAKYAARGTGAGLVAFGVAELAAYGFEYLNNQLMYRPPTSTGTYSGSSVTCQQAKTAGMQPGQDRYFVHTNGVTKVHVILFPDPGRPGVTLPSGYSLLEYCTTTYPNVGGYFPGVLQKNVSDIPLQPARPATQAEVEQGWNQVFQADPFKQEQFWGFIDQTEGLKLWEEALAQKAEVIAGSPAYTQAATTQTQKVMPDSSVQTTTETRQTEYTAVPNEDPATMKNRPLLVGEKTTVTKTNPDGSTETSTETKPPVAPDQQDKPAEEKILVCGLPDTPPCKIDETGTPTDTEGKAAITGAEITEAREAAESVLSDVTQPREFGFSFPTLFPEPNCSPLVFFKWRDFEGSVDLCEKLGFMRTLLQWLWPVLAAMYVWNRTVNANVGA